MRFVIVGAGRVGLRTARVRKRVATKSSSSSAMRRRRTRANGWFEELRATALSRRRSATPTSKLPTRSARSPATERQFVPV